jgi:CzcA family heavy metal efflux pump
MNFTQWAYKHRRSILFMLAALALGGIVTVLQLPVSLFPEVHFPRVVVNLEAGDRPAERMLTEITIPVEEAVRAVPGVRNIRSKTSRGSADISINFGWDENMITATSQIESAVNKAMTTLPQGTTFEVRRMDPTVFPVICYSLSSDTKSLVELHDIAQYQLRPVLTTIKGVAKIDVMGGRQEEYRVDADPARLQACGLTIADISDALSAANTFAAVGRLEDHDKLYLVVSNTSFTDLNQIASTVIRADANGITRLKDIAAVYKDAIPEWTLATADGHDAVLLQVYQQPAGNTVQIAQDIKEKLKVVSGLLPKDIKIANWYDQSELIVYSAASVRDAVIIGIILSVLILLIFLWNIRITLIAAMIVPSVLATTVLMLAVMHMSFNIMTLGGMAAAVGLIIDDAIVMIEHVIRRLRCGDGDHRIRIAQAATEFTKPLAGSSASTIIIFAPLAFLSGITGAFFKALSITMAASLVVSFLVTWLAVPLLAAHLLREKDMHHSEGGRLTAYIHGIYTRLMHTLLPHPWLVLLAIILLLMLGYLGYNRTGSGFIPTTDEGGFILDYLTAPGTSLTETDRLLRKIEAILLATPEVQTYSRRTGLQLGGGITEASEGDFFVRLKTFPHRDIEEVMEDVRTQIEHSIPGLQIEMLQLMEDAIGDLTAVPQPIEVKIFSDQSRQLTHLAPKVAKAIEHIPGVVDIGGGLVLAGDALEITLDRDKLALEGTDAETVTGTLGNYLSGQIATTFPKGLKMVGVRTWISKEQRSTDKSVLELMLRARDGHLFPLKRVATATPIVGQPQIERDDLKRMVAVTGRIAGRDMGSTIRDIKKTLDQPGFLPSGVYYTLGGLYAQQQIAFRGMLAVFISAVVLVFFLLLLLYEHFRVAVSILLTTLLAVSAVFVGLWITGTELNITSMMGMTMVVGIVTEVGIFYFSEFRELYKQSDRHLRLIQAGINRMRPIAMTTLAAILALMSLALGIGHGSAMQQPLAIAIISGLTVQLPLAILVLPVFLSVLKVE